MRSQRIHTALLTGLAFAISALLANAQGDQRPTDAELAAIPLYKPTELGTGSSPSVDLRQALIGGRWQQAMPPTRNQGQTNTCTAWAVAYALKSYHEALDQQWVPDRDSRWFSPSFVYNQINGGVDKGSSIPKAMNIIINNGCATMSTMPFTPDPRARPSSAAFSEAKKFRAAGIERAETVEAMRQALMRGNPIALSIRTNLHFQSGRFDIYNAAEKAYGDRRLKEQQRLQPDAKFKHGYHAVLIVGYDDVRQAFLLMNSWQTDWGKGDNTPGGHCWIAYELCAKMRYDDESLFCRGGYVLNDLKQSIRSPQPEPQALTVVAGGRNSYNGYTGGRHAWSWTVFVAGSPKALASVKQVTWNVPTGSGTPKGWTVSSPGNNFMLVGTHTGGGSVTIPGTVQYKNGKTGKISFTNRFTPPAKRSVQLVQTDKFWGVDPMTKRPTWEWTVGMRGNLTELHQIQSVTYHLHPTFKPPDRTVTTSPLNGFAYTTRGWGVFPLKATVLYKDGSRQQHSLALKFNSPVTKGLSMDNSARFVEMGADGSARYQWTVFVKGPVGVLRRVRNVRYHLHPTFPVNVIDVTHNGDFGFPYSNTGWGVFDVKATLTFDDGSTQQLVHRLKF